MKSRGFQEGPRSGDLLSIMSQSDILEEAAAVARSCRSRAVRCQNPSGSHGCKRRVLSGSTGLWPGRKTCWIGIRRTQQEGTGQHLASTKGWKASRSNHPEPLNSTAGPSAACYVRTGEWTLGRSPRCHLLAGQFPIPWLRADSIFLLLGL